MRRIVCLAAVVLMGFGSMSAQQGKRRPKMSVEEQVSHLKKELSLTDEQTKQVTALYTDFQKKMQEGGENAREQMRTEREKLDNQVKALLTDEQKKAFEKLQAQRPQRGQGRGPRKQ